MHTKVLTAHVPIPLAEKIDQIAARMERSRSRVEQEEERRRMTLEGMADVEAGQVIEHQSVLAWAESLSTGKALAVPR